jgi:hypothetical protein
MGNRGVLHDRDGEHVRDWQLRRWIACRLEWRGRQRALRQPGRWTELFFLDEATAIAAGHRPCAECRHGDFKRWQAAWARAHPGEETRAPAIDALLHRDRLAPGGAKRTFTAPAGALPPGVMVLLDGAPWLLAGGRLNAWTAGGYAETRALPAGREPLIVLTPAVAVAAIAAGYEPAGVAEPGAAG